MRTGRCSPRPKVRPASPSPTFAGYGLRICVKGACLAALQISVLSDHEGESWRYDYRFLEAIR